ncbi:hypothetical protein F7725_026042 [Dissostichus mawsoni]|uniref:Uncharacterized protein n=1 Tax=Dissostichus mawsoni TaxID=36200 RepID=A0A7J5X6W1_DISMA|nr:hypothetical protein F7725_026042 [Dissostichus mawsoni]
MVGDGGGEDLRSLGLLSLGSSRHKQKQGYPFPENTEWNSEIHERKYTTEKRMENATIWVRLAQKQLSIQAAVALIASWGRAAAMHNISPPNPHLSSPSLPCSCAPSRSPPALPPQLLYSHRTFAEIGESAPHGSLCSLPLASCAGI